MRTSFPNRPFFPTAAPLREPFTKTAADASNAALPPTTTSEVVVASDKRRAEILATLEAERAYRDRLEYDALVEASRVAAENQMIDHYDAGAKLHRGQGNRKFVIHFTVAACVTMVALVGIDAIVSAARAQ